MNPGVMDPRRPRVGQQRGVGLQQLAPNVVFKQNPSMFGQNMFGPVQPRTLAPIGAQETPPPDAGAGQNVGLLTALGGGFGQPKPPQQQTQVMMPRASSQDSWNQKAMIDLLTGARVHRGMDGRDLGMRGASPQMRYLIESLRGRRHYDTGGNMIF